MSSAESPDGLSTRLIWYRIDLDEVADLVEEYARELWKDGPWYHRVDWPRVVAVVEKVLQHSCSDGLVIGADLTELLASAERTLGETDREGLAALVLHPLQIRRSELSDGGHRAAAMRQQGVRFVPGACVRSDVGFGVAASQVYPIHHIEQSDPLRSEDTK